MRALRCARGLVWHASLVLLAACSNGRGSLEEQQPAPVRGAQESFSVGGTVTGLTGSGLVLQNNGGDDFTVAGDGSFTFAGRLADGALYNVTVRSQPDGQNCVVRNASGTIAQASVSTVEVSCTANAASGSFSVGGIVSGLSGSQLVLQLNGGDDLAIASNGRFTFATSLAGGTQYRVAVSAQPANPTQVCTIAGGNGTVGGANVTTVRVACASQTFAVGGTVIGLLGSGLALRNEGGDDLVVAKDGGFTFPTEVASGGSYDVTVRTQPSDPRQSCTVINGRGTVAGGDIGNVVVSCDTSDFTIGGTVRDLAGSGLVLRNNGGDELTVNAGGSFTFHTAMPIGATYDVKVAQQPRDPEQSCTVANGSGTVGDRNVTNVTVQCSTRGFLISVRVRDLRGSGLVIQNNGADDLAIASDGRYEFSTPLPSGASYNVTVANRPRGQTCDVRHGSGSVKDSDVRDVEVRCHRGDG